MVAKHVHLVRHGEVENPAGVVYGRMPGFHLSSRGRQQAAAAAEALRSGGIQAGRILSSPLERTRESAAPIAEAFGLPVDLDEDFIEASSRLEGKDYDVSLEILARPEAWKYLVNPFRPSWGESYAGVRTRMLRGLSNAIESIEGGDLIIVSHQMPIWIVVREAQKKTLFHDPRKRRCAHSSITTFDVDGRSLIPRDYRDPGREMPVP